MISKIRVKHGSASQNNISDINLTPITIFVGPNNSGKSKILSEINGVCLNDKFERKILSEIEFEPISDIEIDSIIESFKPDPNTTDIYSFVDHRINVRYRKEDLLRIFKDINNNTEAISHIYLRNKILNLNSQNRTNLTNPQQVKDLKQPSGSSLHALFLNNERRSQLRKIIYDATGYYFVIDPTELGNLKIGLSARSPSSEIEERGWHEGAIAFHSQSLPISQASDGIRAFTGIMTEIFAGNHKVLLIDEPEAFLHPSLSYKLGLAICNSVNQTNKKVFISTHSSDFLMGCIQSGVPINIVRLTYRNEVSTMRFLDSQKILTLMRNPLLRSTGVLSGIFFETVVVTESDTDRAFYQEINQRLLSSNSETGIPNCLFLNAQNKQTVKTIIRPLRELGIPTATIVDVDILKDGGNTWTSFLEAGNIPVIEHQPMGTIRTLVKKAIESTEMNMKTQGGINILSGPSKEAANNLFDKLQEYGLFVVRAGELESWLKDLGSSSKHGTQWLIEIFERMGEDPNLSSYTKPSTGDVWTFMTQVRSWLINPNRKGIPE